MSIVGRALFLHNGIEALRLIKAGHPFPIQDGRLNLLALAIQNCPILELIDAMIARLKKNQVNDIDFENFSPLIKAAQERNVPIIDRLVKAGAIVNLQNKFGHTALHHVMAYKPMSENVPNSRIETVECLLKHGASIDETEDETDSTAKTPLTLYIESGELDPDIIRLFVANGATPPTIKVRNPHNLHAVTINAAIQTGLQQRRSEVTKALTPHFSAPGLLALIHSYV
jgi:hypothetical protein